MKRAVVSGLLAALANRIEVVSGLVAALAKRIEVVRVLLAVVSLAAAAGLAADLAGAFEVDLEALLLIKDFFVTAIGIYPPGMDLHCFTLTCSASGVPNR